MRELQEMKAEAAAASPPAATGVTRNKLLLTAGRVGGRPIMEKQLRALAQTAAQFSGGGLTPAAVASAGALPPNGPTFECRLWLFGLMSGIATLGGKVLTRAVRRSRYQPCELPPPPSAACP